MAAQTAPHDAALTCISIPAVATVQSLAKPPFLKALLPLASARTSNQDTLLARPEELLLVHQEHLLATDA